MATNELLWQHAGRIKKIIIYRFKHGFSGEAKPEGTIDLYVYADLRPIPLGIMSSTSWLEPTALALVRFLGKEYVLGRGKEPKDVSGELAIYLPESAPRWCMHCGDEMPKCCPSCNRPLDHICATPQNSVVGCRQLCS